MQFLNKLTLIALCLTALTVATQAQFRDVDKNNRTTKLEDKFGSEGKFDWSRVYVGGQFGGNILNGRINALIAPDVGYYIKENWLVAAGPTFEFYNSDNINGLGSRRFYGGHIYSRYSVFKGVFAHAEYEHVAYRVRNDNLGRDDTGNFPSLYAGAGMRLGGFVSASILYNFLFDQDNPLQFRNANIFGFAWSNPVVRITFGGNVGGLFR